MRITLQFWKWFRSSESENVEQLIVPEYIATGKTLAKRVIVYKDPEITKFVQRVPYYIDKNSHEIGDLVRLRNDALALITDVGGRKFPLFISPYRSDLVSLLDKLNLIREHQMLMNAEWPLQNDPRFREKLQSLFSSFGFRPEGRNKVDPEACFKQTENITLKYYQKIVSTYAIYGPYRGCAVIHSMGTGKTCTAIAAIDNFLAFHKIEEETSNKSDPISDPSKIQALNEAASTIKKTKRAMKREILNEPQATDDDLEDIDHLPIKTIEKIAAVEKTQEHRTSPPRRRSAKPKISAPKAKVSDINSYLNGSATPAALVSASKSSANGMYLKGGAIRTPPKVFFVIPPSANLEQNFRSELARCPSKIRDMILAQREKGSKMDPVQAANRIINQNVNIISYVSLSNRLKKNILSLEDSLLVLDEAHNFLEPPKQYAHAYNYLYDAIKKTKECKILLLTGTPIYKSVTDLPRLLNLLKRDSEMKFPETEDAFYRKYFKGNNIDARVFIDDIKGYISYYDAEGDLSYFARKIELLPIITHVTDDHYKRYLESRKTENKSYGFGEKTPNVQELVLSKNPKFKSPISGYFKRSSAMTNVPISYRKHDKWPAKFAAVADQIAKYPNEKHFVFSRHTAQGSNAFGEYLEQELGWDRMSNNKYDHGSRPPTAYNPLNKELYALKAQKLDPEARKAQKARLIKQHLKKPYHGFVVANKATSQKELAYDKDLYNDTDFNVDGKLCRVFIVDERFSEGLSLLNTLNVFLLEPPYSFQAYRQIIARAVRNCSHLQIPHDKWQVKIHRYIADLDDEHETSDGVLAQYSAAAQAVLQQIIDQMMAGSIEAGFTNIGASTALIKTKHTLWQRLLDLVKRPFFKKPQ